MARCWSFIEEFNQQNITSYKLQSFCWSELWRGSGPLYSYSTIKILLYIYCSNFAGPKYGRVLVLYIVIQQAKFHHMQTAVVFSDQKYGKLLVLYIIIQPAKYYLTLTAVIVLVHNRTRCWSFIQSFNVWNVILCWVQSVSWYKLLQSGSPLFIHSNSKMSPYIYCSHFAGPA